MMCDVLPTISEDSISQRSSQFSGGEDALVDQHRTAFGQACQDGQAAGVIGQRGHGGSLTKRWAFACA